MSVMPPELKDIADKLPCTAKAVEFCIFTVVVSVVLGAAVLYNILTLN